MSNKVVVILPKVGLGNMLLLWAQGFVFARQHQLPFFCSGWRQIHFGGLLRRENKKRWYGGYFRNNSISASLNTKADLLLKRKQYNVELSKVELASDELFVFNKLETNSTMFLSLQPFADDLKNALMKLLRPKLLLAFQQLSKPEIAVHIRRGDFTLSHLSTPLEYFVQVINEIRKINKRDVPVLVFTDAKGGEIESILSLPAVKVAKTDADILDILWMSKSKILVLSPSSSFSYWAAFLSDAKVILKDTDWQKGIKNSGGHYQEIRWNDEIMQDTHLLKTLVLDNSDNCRK